MENIIQIQNITKSELFERLEDIVDVKLKSLLKANKHEKISVKEVSVELGVTVLTVHNYIKRGDLKATKIGNRVFIRRDDLEEALIEKKSLSYKR